eukprot:3962485-Amphidinium_carterae.3
METMLIVTIAFTIDQITVSIYSNTLPLDKARQLIVRHEGVVEAGQSTSLQGLTFVMLHRPMGCTVHQYTTEERRTLALSSFRSHAQEAATFTLRGTMGPPLGVWNIEHWQQIDNDAPATLWLDH